MSELRPDTNDVQVSILETQVRNIYPTRKTQNVINYNEPEDTTRTEYAHEYRLISQSPSKEELTNQAYNWDIYDNNESPNRNTPPPNLIIPETHDNSTQTIEDTTINVHTNNTDVIDVNRYLLNPPFNPRGIYPERSNDKDSHLVMDMVKNKPISDTESVIQHNNDVTDKTISLLSEAYMSDNIPDINLHNLHIDNNGQYGYTTPLVQNIVQIKIENVSYPAMIDSGASHCIISKDAFNALPKHTQQQMFPIETSCKLANNTHIKTIGVISLTVHIQQSSCQIPLYIIDSCVQPIILGLTFLHKAKATLSFDSQTITVQKPYSVITTNHIELKPFSDTVISGRLCGNVQQIDVLEGECLPQNLLHSDIVVLSSAVTLADGIIPVCLRNTSVTPLCLHKNDTIVLFQPLSKARYDKKYETIPANPW